MSKLSYINLVIREVFPTTKEEKNHFQAAVEKEKIPTALGGTADHQSEVANLRMFSSYTLLQNDQLRNSFAK